MQKLLPNKVPDTNNFRHDWNKMVEVLNRSHLISSSDILVKQTNHGTSLFLMSQPIAQAAKAGLNPKGYFNESASYAVNDLVVVDCNKKYSVSFDPPPSGSHYPAITAGDFYCTTAVPASGSGRVAGNVYYPFAPMIPTSSYVTVSGSILNNNFWFPLSPMIKLPLCIGGVSQTVFVNGVPSGSLFNLSQLPHQ